MEPCAFSLSLIQGCYFLVDVTEQGDHNWHTQFIWPIATMWFDKIMVWFVNLFNISMQLSYVWTDNPERPSTGKLLGTVLATLHCKSASGHTHVEVIQANRGATNSHHAPPQHHPQTWPAKSLAHTPSAFYHLNISTYINVFPSKILKWLMLKTTFTCTAHKETASEDQQREGKNYTFFLSENTLLLL